MAGTYSQILLHAVFSTKHRKAWLTPDVAVRLYPYIGGIIRAEKGALYEIGGSRTTFTCISAGGLTNPFRI